MKNTFKIAILIAFAFAGSIGYATAQEQQPPCSGSFLNALQGYDIYGNLIIGSTALCYNTYCYCTTQTTSDSWDNVIKAVGNEGTCLVEYECDYALSGGGTSHVPWTIAAFPINLVSGSGGMPINIRIRLTYSVPPPPPGQVDYVSSDCSVYYPGTPNGVAVYYFNILGSCPS